jgi:hypothetical protein
MRFSRDGRQRLVDVLSLENGSKDPMLYLVTSFSRKGSQNPMLYLGFSRNDSEKPQLFLVTCFSRNGSDKTHR